MPYTTLHTGTDDKILLDAIAKGSAQAFSILFDKYWNLVYTNTLTLVRSVPLAEDLTQEIFFKIWETRDKLEDIDNFKTWLYVVGRNRVVSEMRKKVASSGEDRLEELTDRYELPSLELEMKDTYRLILDGIGSLPKKQQQIFRMSRFEGLSHQQIAQQMGISRETVKWHIVTAINTLKNYLHHQNRIITVAVIMSILLFKK